MNYKYFLLVLSLIFMSCSVSKKIEGANPLDSVLKSGNPKIKAVMDNVKEHELQIIYTQIKRASDGTISFEDYQYNVNAKNYFYSNQSYPQFCEKSIVICFDMRDN